jgi:hypothetical protein
MIAAGVRRVEVCSHVDHDLSHKWLISVGAVLETPEPFEYGREGQLFLRNILGPDGPGGRGQFGGWRGLRG